MRARSIYSLCLASAMILAAGSASAQDSDDYRPDGQQFKLFASCRAVAAFALKATPNDADAQNLEKTLQIYQIIFNAHGGNKAALDAAATKQMDWVHSEVDGGRASLRSLVQACLDQYSDDSDD